LKFFFLYNLFYTKYFLSIFYMNLKLNKKKFDIFLNIQ
jgi:hypothetical protein